MTSAAHAKLQRCFLSINLIPSVSNPDKRLLCAPTFVQHQTVSLTSVVLVVRQDNAMYLCQVFQAWTRRTRLRASIRLILNSAQLINHAFTHPRMRSRLHPSAAISGHNCRTCSAGPCIGAQQVRGGPYGNAVSRKCERKGEAVGFLPGFWSALIRCSQTSRFEKVSFARSLVRPTDFQAVPSGRTRFGDADTEALQRGHCFNRLTCM